MLCQTIRIAVSCLLITDNIPCRCDSQNNPKYLPNTSQLRAPCGASRNHYGVQVLQSKSCLLGHEKANYVGDWIKSPVLHLPARMAEKFTIYFQNVQRGEETCSVWHNWKVEEPEYKPRFGGTRHPASLSAPFFQQHLFNSHLCYILLILTTFQTFSLL